VTLGVPAISDVQGSDPRGVFLVLLSATLYGGYIVGSARTLQGIHAVVAMAYISTGAAVSYAILTAATRSFTPGIGLSGWGPIAAMGVISTVVAAGMFLAAIRRLGPARAATASTVEPLFTIVFAAIVLGERLALYQAAGGLLILVGVVIVLRERETADPTMV
jgi:drug/metabolite transporter (DMT)-like permease